MFPPNTWQMMTFLNPLDALIPEIPFSLLCRFWVQVTCEAQGSVSVALWGGGASTFFFGQGSGQRAVLTPAPPELKGRPPMRQGQSALFHKAGSAPVRGPQTGIDHLRSRASHPVALRCPQMLCQFCTFDYGGPLLINRIKELMKPVADKADMSGAHSLNVNFRVFAVVQAGVPGLGAGMVDCLWGGGCGQCAWRRLWAVCVAEAVGSVRGGGCGQCAWRRMWAVCVAEDVGSVRGGAHAYRTRSWASGNTFAAPVVQRGTAQRGPRSPARPAFGCVAWAHGNGQPLRRRSFPRPSGRWRS